MLVGTAGHVDHGKSALVRALTGVDTDTLPEEKRRGITLEPGFAPLRLPSGRTVGLVDVPGHARFVKAMAAGAGGVDVALLVVAADEGVMPQTREHLDICALLGVRRGVLVVTKADLLPGLGDGWLSLLEADLRALTAGTFLDGAPLVAVSAKTGEGLGALGEALEAAVADADADAGDAGWRSASGPFFMAIDRAFSVKGFGLVVTGTVLSGRLEADAAVSLLPGRPGPWRVRGLQTHGAAVARVVAGQRAAINLPELEVAHVHRGMALTLAGQLAETRALDVEVQLLPSARALPRRARRLVTLGTAQVEAVVRLLSDGPLAPGEAAKAQLRFAGPVAALPGQRFILREAGAAQGTIGGGRVLTLDAPKRRRDGRAALEVLASGGLEARVAVLVAEAGHRGLTRDELFVHTAAGAQALEQALDAATARRDLLLVDRESRRYLSARVFARLEARALEALEAFHRQTPEADGMPREELRQRLDVPHAKTFGRLLARLLDAGQLEAHDEWLRLPGRGRAWEAESARLLDEAAAMLANAALAPPTVDVLAHRLKVDEARALTLLQALTREGRAVRAKDLFFDAPAVAALEATLRAHLAAHGDIDTQRFKELTGQSRKYAIPLAEYFDREKVTLRVGERRVLRRG